MHQEDLVIDPNEPPRPSPLLQREYPCNFPVCGFCLLMGIVCSLPVSAIAPETWIAVPRDWRFIYLPTVAGAVILLWFWSLALMKHPPLNWIAFVTSSFLAGLGLLLPAVIP